MIEEDAEELDNIEQYLRTLRKKMDHQIKNPFDMPFANFTFEELTSWKNNVLQLDATSRLYGQRVDFLHCGALQILGSVITNDRPRQPMQQKSNQKIQQIQDYNPIQKHLEIPAKINGQIQTSLINPLLWQQICKKRDALHQIMMNEIAIDSHLRIAMFPSEKPTHVHLTTEDQSLAYLKIIDQNKIPIKFLAIYKEIQEFSSDSNIFIMAETGNHEVRQPNQYQYQSFIDLGFGNFKSSDEPIVDFNDCPNSRESSCHKQSDRPISPTNHSIDLSYAESSQCYQFEQWSEDKSNRMRKKQLKNNARRQNREKKDEYVRFNGIHPTKSEVFLTIEGQELQNQIDKFLLPRDSVLAKIVKYHHPFRKVRKAANSKIKINQQRVSQDQYPSYFNECTENSLEINKSLLSRPKIQEAVLPIKQMKKRIKSTVELTNNQKINFSDIKKTFSNEEPLDIFITVLHIAAQEQVLVCM